MKTAACYKVREAGDITRHVTVRIVGDEGDQALPLVHSELCVDRFAIDEPHEYEGDIDFHVQEHRRIGTGLEGRTQAQKSAWNQSIRAPVRRRGKLAKLATTGNCE
ncbi:MAG: hypothetical protein ABIQ78_10245 [Dokdonella sp.]